MRLSRVSLFCASTPLVSAWGTLGHHLTGIIAQQYMTPAAKDMLFTILSTSQTASSTAINATNIDSTSSDLSSLLADAVVWADRIKNHNNTFDAFHYVHTAEESNCTYIDARDCKDGVCVVGGIKRFASSFLSSCNYGDSAPFLTPEVDQESTEARIRDIAESIKFMIHFIGDISQPLHVCGREKGGSQTKLIFNGEKVRLHQVWDSHLLHRHKNMTFQNNISRYSTHMLGLARKIVKTEKRTSFSSSSSWSNSNWLQVIQWARRTKGVDCSTVWPTFDSFHPHSHSNYTAASKPANHKLAHGESSLIITPSYDLALNGYYDAVIDTVEQQVVLGGIWMAEMVNFLANEVGWSSSFSAGGEGGYGNYYDHQVSSLESLDDRSSSSTSSSTFSHQDPHRSSPTLVKIKNRKRKGSFTLPICQRMFMHYNLDRIIRFLPSTTSSTSTSAPTNKPTSTSSSSSLSKLVTNPVSTSTPHKKKKKNKKRHRHYHHHQNSPQVINIPRESEVDDEDITAEAMARWFETRLYHMAVDKEEEDGSDGSDDMMVVVMEDEKNVDAKENVLEHQTTRPTKRKKHWHRNRRRVRNGE